VYFGVMVMVTGEFAITWAELAETV